MNIIKHTKNLGVGRASITGFKAAKKDNCDFFIKIDAESTEFEVLEGMDFILKNIKPVICLEIGDLGVKGAKKSRNVIDHLLNYGYEVFEFNNESLYPHKLKDKYNYGNLLFKHPN